MVMKVTNFAVTTLASGITNVATSLTVAGGAGALFPVLGGSDYFYCSLANNSGNNEIVKVTARSTDTFMIVRAQDNTTAIAWNIGDKVELRWVAAEINNTPKLDELNTFTQPQVVGTGVATGHATTVGQWQGQTGIAYQTAGTSTAYTLTPVPAISTYTAGQSFYVTFNAASGAAPTLQISGIATPPNLVRQLPDGTYQNIAAGEIPNNHRSRVTLLSASQAWVEEVLPGSEINVATAKTTPVDADTMALIDSAASNVLKKVTWANVKATIFAVFGLATVNLFTKAQRGAFVTLTDAATVAIDISLANMFNLTLGGNRTLGVPTNAAAGQQGAISIYQDKTGSRTLAYSWIYAWAGGTAGVLSTVGCTRDFLAYSVDSYATGTVTITIATPGVVTLTAHGLITGQRCQLTTTGALPTGLTVSTTYYINVIDANTFNLCTTLANVASSTYIATSGSQSGTHTIVAGSITLALSKAVP